jgi:serine/threonine protein phosphatase 1
LGGLETLVSYGVPPEILANREQIVEVNAAFHDALPKPHLLFFAICRSRSWAISSLHMPG